MGLGLPDGDVVVMDHTQPDLPEATAFYICGCYHCMGLQGKDAIYDGAIIYVTAEREYVNRFRGEGSAREERIDNLIRPLGAEPK